MGRVGWVQQLLKSQEGLANLVGWTQILARIRQGVLIAQAQQGRELVGCQRLHALAHVMAQHKLDKRLLLVAVLPTCLSQGLRCAD